MIGSTEQKLGMPLHAQEKWMSLNFKCFYQAIIGNRGRDSLRASFDDPLPVQTVHDDTRILHQRAQHCVWSNLQVMSEEVCWRGEVRAPGRSLGSKVHDKLAAQNGVHHLKAAANAKRRHIAVETGTRERKLKRRSRSKCAFAQFV
jgi:hypothetical protein